MEQNEKMLDYEPPKVEYIPVEPVHAAKSWNGGNGNDTTGSGNSGWNKGGGGKPGNGGGNGKPGKGGGNGHGKH